MPVSQLTQLAQEGNLDQFETRCLEFLEQGHVQLCDLAEPFEHLLRSAASPRLAELGQVVLENGNASQDFKAALRIARTALLSIPDGSDAMRARTAALYRELHGDVPGFEMLLEQAGLLSGRPPRNALRVIDFCVSLKPGDPVMSRTEEQLFEVVDLDHARGLYTVRRAGRPTTLPTLDFARRFEHIDPDDFRVLRELRPERLAQLIEDDPVTLVIGLIRSHGEWIDQDSLKAELAPRYISESQWSKWWTRTRTLLKKSPNIVLEGRNPLIVRYSAKAQTLEDEARIAFNGSNDPSRWLDVIGGYLREKKSQKEAPDTGLLSAVRERCLAHARSALAKRPGEALTTLLVLQSIDALAGVADSPAPQAVREMLRNAGDPLPMVRAVDDAALWELAIPALLDSRGEQGPALVMQLLKDAPAAVLDTMTKVAVEHRRLADVQAAVDAALADPVRHPELMYWLWKGPREAGLLSLPLDADLLGITLTTLSALGKSIMAPDPVIKRFRQRIKSALSLKDFARAADSIRAVDAARAITLKTQLARLDGLGDNAPARLLDALRDAHPILWRTADRRVEPWADPTVIFTTKRGLERKTEERDHLVNVTMRENAKRIGEAAALGDLSENSEYKFALEERDLLRARLAQMNNELSIARAIEPFEVTTDVVSIGTRVTLRDVNTREARTMTFLGPFDTDLDEGVFNYKAPVSLKVMGLKVGDRAALQLDAGEHLYEIAEIQNALTLLPT